MRLFVTAVVLACATAQSQVVDTSVQKPGVLPQPSLRPRIRQAAPPGAVAANMKTANVPPETPVVTLKGVCRDRQAKSACEKVITRQELDRFVNASSGDPSARARGRVAVEYARTVALSSLAEQQGLDKNPALAKELEVQLKLVRMRFLAGAYMQTLQRQTPGGVAEAAIQKYYDTHREEFEQVQLRRVAVPFAVPTESGRPLDRSAAKAEMADLRSRAVAGEDLNRLLLDAYKNLHIQAVPPPVNVMTLRRSNVQGDEEKAFTLTPGEVSTVLDLPAALAVLKLESKELMPIESVRPEIEARLRQVRVQNEVSKLAKKVSAEFNLQYLELPSQPDMFDMTAISMAASRGSSRRISGTR